MGNTPTSRMRREAAGPSDAPELLMPGKLLDDGLHPLTLLVTLGTDLVPAPCFAECEPWISGMGVMGERVRNSPGPAASGSAPDISHGPQVTGVHTEV